MKPASHDLWLLAAVVIGVLLVGNVSMLAALLTVGVVTAVFLTHAARCRMSGAPVLRAGGSRRLIRRTAIAALSVWGLLVLNLATLSSVSTSICLVLIGVLLLVVWYSQASPRALNEATDDPAELARAVKVASDEQLAELWQRSAAALRHSCLPSSTMRYAEIRRLVLDEAERRDRGRITQWLSENPRSDSLKGYLR